MRKKIFLISLLVSLPFWWGINILAENLEDFWFQQKIVKNPEILTAAINQKILEKKIKRLELEKLQEERLENLEIEARAAISVEVGNNGKEKFLFEKNSQKPLAVASLTKLMTALIVFYFGETYSPSQIITITKEAVEQEGSSKYGDLRVGESLSVETLLYIMLIESSNDAAFALTEPIEEKAFVELMNLYAEEIGLENTYFVNSTGLEPDDPQEPKNLSTAQDLVNLTKFILKNYPQIFEITTNQSYKALKPDGTVHHFIAQNTNELLGEIPEIIGGKTGWGIEAGGCLLLVLDNPNSNKYYISIVLGAKDRFAEMRKLINPIMQ